MREFNCKCFGEGAITNDDHTVKMSVWHDKDNPNEEPSEYYIDAVNCPKCGTLTTIYTSDEYEEEDNELMFLAMDIKRETEKLTNENEIIATNGMTKSELKAYKLGVKNTILSLDVVLDFLESYGEADFTVHIKGSEAPTEYMIPDLVNTALSNRE